MHNIERWSFPLPRTHTGILQANGVMGVMVWGEGNVLRITVNRGDYWDHRGGKSWEEGMSYAHLQHYLAAEDEAALYRTFAHIDTRPGEPLNPTLLPFGRMELVLQPGTELCTGDLNLSSGQIVIRAERAADVDAITLDLSMVSPLLHISFSPGMPMPTIRRVPAWDFVGDYLQSVSFVGPQYFDSDLLAGWVQTRPADPPLCLGYRANSDGVWLGLSYGDSVDVAQKNVQSTIDNADYEQLLVNNDAWWSGYWETIPRLTIPNPRLDSLYRYGMYKFAGLTHPDGIAAGLQGPWIEEVQLPPWAGDYHFNINVQMCYWPAYRANLLSHLTPLFNMIKTWLPRLRENARIFAGIDDGFMLPHSVDDRGTCIGGFWTGSVDHGSAAWVAEMMFRAFQYSGDRTFLAETAFPFMVGVMRVYETMLVRNGDEYVLPVSVSPEYRGSALDAWGINASFQLACIHNLLRNLIEAARILETPPNRQWLDIQEHLPRASLCGPRNEEEIALWEGTALEFSHRHHSHLAGIVPFDVIDLDDPAWHPILERSLRRWVGEGMGEWSGWAMPWAAMIHTAFFNAEMAELILEIWERVFTNEGRGTLHDSNFFPGMTLIGTPLLIGRLLRQSRAAFPDSKEGAEVHQNDMFTSASDAPPPERMQMDAGMGVTAAIMDMLLQTRGGVNYLFPGTPDHWSEVAFERMLTQGAFLVSAARESGHVTHITVTSQIGGLIRFANPWNEEDLFSCNSPGQVHRSATRLEIDTEAGQTIVLRLDM